ncbi:hypothetical protein EJB05_24919, partial [Eragrostis curvula]
MVATDVARNKSAFSAMLMAVGAMGSLQHTLLKQQQLLHHRILPLLLPPLLRPHQQPLLLLPTAVVPKPLQKVRLPPPKICLSSCRPNKR